MTAYTSARRSARYDRTMASGLSPRLKASSTSSRSTRLSPTRKTPGGSSQRGTVTVRGSKSTVDMVSSLLSTQRISPILLSSAPSASRAVSRNSRNSPTTASMSPLSALVFERRGRPGRGRDVVETPSDTSDHRSFPVASAWPKTSAGVSPSSAWVFDQFTPLRRLAIKNRVEKGHGTQSNPLGMKDLRPSASRFWKNQARLRNRVTLTFGNTIQRLSMNAIQRRQRYDFNKEVHYERIVHC